MIKATGQLRHHFWGTYHATIVLVFESENKAFEAMPMLGEGWKPHATERKAFVWFGPDEKFKLIKEKLVSFGADAHKITSMAKSIDFGEKFSINIP